MTEKSFPSPMGNEVGLIKIMDRGFVILIAMFPSPMGNEVGLIIMERRCDMALDSFRPLWGMR